MSEVKTQKIGEMFRQLSPNGLGLNDIPELSDFEIDQNKTKGIFAEFSHAKEIKSGTPCGIKKISKSGHYSKGFSVEILDKLVSNEISIHCDVNHKYIIVLYGYFEDDDNYYLIQELGDLDLYFYRLTPNGGYMPLEEEITLKYMKMVAVALQYLHNNRIIHKDIKIENIIIQKSKDIVKITDFGLSEYIDQQLITHCGTAEYSAPEIKNGQFATEKTDMYALGIATYVLVHGIYPEHQKLKFKKHVSQDFRKLVSAMMHHNPSQRLTLQEFFNQDIIKRIDV